MRALFSLPLVAALALLLGGCVSPVVVDHRAGTDFTQYRSYAIEAPDADQQALSLNGQRVQEAVHRELADGPLSRAGQEQADLIVRYAFVPVEKFQGSTLQFGFGWFNRGYGVGATTPVEGETYEEQKLQIALVERSSNEVVWEATSRDTLYESMSTERRKERINTMVTEMFKRFPPGSAN